MKKIFIVGCSRSGTSLIQQRIVEEFNIWSLPETEFFIKKKEDAKQRLALASDVISKANMNLVTKIRVANNLDVFNWLVNNIDIETTYNFLFNDERYAFLQQLLSKIVGNRTSATGWVEKTPTHYQHCEKILESDDTKIIFVIRNGIDVAASIRDRALKSPELFENQLKLQYSINLWNDSIKQAKRVADNKRVFIQPFEQFVLDEAYSLSKIATFAQLDVRREKTTMKIKGEIETWKKGTDEATSPPEEKWKLLFSKSELSELKEKLDLSSYRKLCGVHND